MFIIKLLAAIVAVVIIGVIAGGAAMYFRLIPVPGPVLAFLLGAKPPEYSARYYPPDTLAYAWVTLTPGDGQLDTMQDIWGRLNGYPGFEDLVDELKTNFTAETGIDFETELMPWIGPEMAGAVIEIEGDGNNGIALDDGVEAWSAVKAATLIGVRDRDAAGIFLAKWREYMAGESGADFAADSYRGIETWVDEVAYQTYALTDDWLVYATDQTTLQLMLDRIEDGDGDSLADDANFRAAQAALPERRFSSVYVDYQQGLELVADLAGGFGALPPGAFVPGAFTEQAPDWVAGATGWVELGVTMEVVSPTVSTFGLETVELREPANLLPADTLGFMAGAFDPDVDHWRVALREYNLADLLPDTGLIDEINAGVDGISAGSPPELSANATLADALDLGFWLVNDTTGIDLEADFFDYLAGEAILAVRHFDFDGVAADPAANAVDVVAMLSYREDGKNGLAGTMSEVANLLQTRAGLESAPLDVGADDDATVFDLSSTLGMLTGADLGYRPGYVLHDEYLTVGTTQTALAAIVERQNGTGDSLFADAEYQRAVGHLPAGRQFLGYVDVPRIIGQLDADDLDLEPEQYRILQEGLGVAAFSSSSEEDYSRGTAVLTLFPE